MLLPIRRLCSHHVVDFLPTLTSCVHVQEYLAVGEAPDQIRNCFQQRSRWTKVRTDSSWQAAILYSCISCALL